MNRETKSTQGPSAQEILQSRARILARRPEASAPASATIDVLEFRLAKERYALETRFVREVYPLKELTPLPGTPPFVIGIVNVRGHVLPVYDLKKFFELPETGLTDLHRIILLQNDDLELGLLADASVGVRTIALSDLQPSLPTLTGIRNEYLKGVTGERLIVLDAGRILADPRIIVHDEPEP